MPPPSHAADLPSSDAVPSAVSSELEAVLPDGNSLGALARQATQALRPHRVHVLGVSHGSVVLDLELGPGVVADPQWAEDLCPLVGGGPTCVEKSFVTVQEFDGPPVQAWAERPKSGAPWGAIVGDLFGALVLVSAVAFAAKHKLRPGQKQIEKHVEPQTPVAKPQQDDDNCSTATPSSGPDLDTSLGSNRYTCGSTSVGVTTV